MLVPENLQYTSQHEWLSGDATTVTVGITAFAADALGDVVYLQVPEAGAEVAAGTVCGEVESTKSVSDLYSPVDGTVEEVNGAALDNPSVVNSDPYGTGWLMRIRITGTPTDLLDAAQYSALIGPS